MNGITGNNTMGFQFNAISDPRVGRDHVLVIVIPLMVLGVIIASVPLFGSIRHNRAMRAGRIETTESARQEADFWHRMLGRRKDPRVVATPVLVSNEEVARIGVPPGAHHTVNGESVWTTPR